MSTSPTPSVNNRPVPLDLAEFLARRMRDISASINCMMPGTVQSFNATNQTVTVSLNISKVVKAINPLDNISAMSDQVLNNPTFVLVEVPVVILSGGGAYLTFPITIGDTCLVFFCDRDMDIWFQTAQIAPPNSERVHNINDAIAIIGIRDLKHSLANYNTSIASLIDNTGERLAQVGFMQPYAGSTAPSGWLLCFGQAVNRVTYANLFACIGITYGHGNGTTTFNVPDMRGRTFAGLDNMGGSNANRFTTPFFPNRDVLGGTGGEEAHQLTVLELAEHEHVQTIVVSGGGSIGSEQSGGATGSTASYNITEPEGGDEEHQNIQPTMVGNWLIKI